MMPPAEPRHAAQDSSDVAMCFVRVAAIMVPSLPGGRFMSSGSRRTAPRIVLIGGLAVFRPHNAGTEVFAALADRHLLGRVSGCLTRAAGYPVRSAVRVSRGLGTRGAASLDFIARGSVSFSPWGVRTGYWARCRAISVGVVCY